MVISGASLGSVKPAPVAIPSHKSCLAATAVPGLLSAKSVFDSSFHLLLTTKCIYFRCLLIFTNVKALKAINRIFSHLKASSNLLYTFLSYQ
jgi:hypothetical protein